MDDAGGVSGGQTVAHLRRDIQEFARRVYRRDRRAFDVFHDDVVRTHIVDLADVRVIQGRDGFRFPPESFTEFRRAKLDCDNTIEARVARLPYLSHAAFSNSGDDFVRAEFCADGERHFESP